MNKEANGSSFRFTTVPRGYRVTVDTRGNYFGAPQSQSQVTVVYKRFRAEREFGSRVGRTTSKPKVMPTGANWPATIYERGGSPVANLEWFAYAANMIRGAHFLLYSTNPEADRAFFRDVLGFPYVDDGGGWLIFKLPPAEMGIHPSDGSFQQQHGDAAIAGSVLYLMCDDVRGMVQNLQSKGVNCTAPEEEEWGISTTIALPSGGRVGLYQPTHKLAIEW